MYDHIKRTLKQSAIYSMGNISTKLIGIVLLPLYIKYLTVSDYGVLAIIEVTIIILVQILSLGQGQAIIRLYNLNEYQNKRNQCIFTIISSILIIGLTFNIIGQNIIIKLTSYSHDPEAFNIYFRTAFFIISFRIISIILLGLLRAKEKSFIYAMSNIVKLLVIMGLNIYFVAFLRIGLRGILYAYLIGDGILFLILLVITIPEMKIEFDFKIFRRAVSFGFPLIITSFAGMLLLMGDRYILKFLINYKEVGIYNLGYKIAGIINVLLIQSFQLGMVPIAYKVYEKSEDKRFYSKMLTYFLYILLWFGLGLSIFCKEIVYLFSRNNMDYYAAVRVIPLLTLALIFMGAKQTVSIGLLIKEKTKYLAFGTIGAAVLNIILNLILIPKYKMMGAAVTTLVSFIALYIFSYYFAGKFYRIPFENLKLFKMFCLSLFLFFISSTFSNMNLLFSITSKIVVLMLFPLILYVLKFYEPVEIQRIKEFVNILRLRHSRGNH